MPVLVTGAAGFAGGHLIDLLASQRQHVVAWHRPGRAAPRDVAGVEWQAVDMLDRGAVRRAIASVRPAIVYHCAGAPHVGQAWKDVMPTFETNVRATHHLIEAVRDAHAEARVLIPSSGMVYAPASHPLDEDDPVQPRSPYGLSKLAQELLG